VPPWHDDGLAVPRAGSSDSGLAIDALAAALLAQLRHEQQASEGSLSAGPPLPQEVEDALYAWGVSCHEAGCHADASALFGALCRRQPPSLRLFKAAGASHLAGADPARSAQAYAQAHELATADAEVLFFWAQAEGLLGQAATAVRRARQAAGLARAFPHKWPGLQSWCDELLVQLEAKLSIQP
jgi:hypothetical protein